ncbi:MAG: transporter substrate-binding protein [Thermodesulfobacteriota bacterium]|nr:transporter substrate-binding protein [Thermodesulfobacteriota bacterium]
MYTPYDIRPEPTHGTRVVTVHGFKGSKVQGCISPAPDSTLAAHCPVKTPARTVTAGKPVAHWNLFGRDSYFRQVFGLAILSFSPTLNPAYSGKPRTCEPFPRIYALCILFIFSAWGFWLHSAPEARADEDITIGLLEEPKTLNVWLASDAWSTKVLSQIYQPLYIREPKTLKLIPWLAADDPVFDAAALSYTVKIRPSKWSDGSDLTSEDVAFTGNLIKEFKVPRFVSNWEFISRIETLDKQTVRFHLREPKAIFLSRTLGTPIVQKKQWAPIAENAKKTQKPLLALLREKVTDPVSNGPFVLKEWRQGAYLCLKKNPHFFGERKEISGHRLGPYIDGIIFKFFGTTDAVILALLRGSIDMFWWGLQQGYLQDLEKDKNIRIFTSEKNALYYVGFNLRKKPFDDIHFRKAVALSTDKDFITTRILQGYALDERSIVPYSNALWYNPDVAAYGEGLSRDERIRKAYEILSQGGYTWKRSPVTLDGKVANGEEIRMPDGNPMKQFTILTPPADYDPQRAMVGIMIQEWLKLLGMPVTSKPMPLGSLIQQVKTRRQFDLFVMGYGNLSLDPDYLRNFFTSRNDRPNGWNTCGYRNPRFDKMADASANAMDTEERKHLIYEMQNIIMDDLPWIPLYSPKLAEAVRGDRFTGWVQMVGGIGNRWSFCTIKPIPKGNAQD